jgi:hypothetical protein
MLSQWRSQYHPICIHDTKSTQNAPIFLATLRMAADCAGGSANTRYRRRNPACASDSGCIGTRISQCGSSSRGQWINVLPNAPLCYFHLLPAALSGLICKPLNFSQPSHSNRKRSITSRFAQALAIHVAESIAPKAAGRFVPGHKLLQKSLHCRYHLLGLFLVWPMPGFG